VKKSTAWFLVGVFAVVAFWGGMALAHHQDLQHYKRVIDAEIQDQLESLIERNYDMIIEVEILIEKAKRATSAASYRVAGEEG